MSAGLDEVGMGCLAGPVTVAVVAFPTDMRKIPGLGDSKKLSKRKRELLAPIIIREASYIGVGWSHPSIIDEYGLAEAWNRAALDALEGMPTVERLVIDGIRNVTGWDGPQETMVKADDKVWQVSAASIVAKVVRDLEMSDLSKHYRGYGWETNAGYGSDKHREAIKRLGPCAYHRHSFITKLVHTDPGPDCPT